MSACVADSVVLELPYDSSAPSIARHALAQWGANAEADVAISELVANAVQHGKPPIRLLAIRTWDFVHVEVHDERHDFGSPQADSVGLRLVEAFTTSWGVTPFTNDGKAVWAEFEP
jgi:anti-sigma regulatory factor (Ser/Thr protein kinase)